MLDFHVYNKCINEKSYHMSTENFRIANAFLELLNILLAFMLKFGKMNVLENECSEGNSCVFKTNAGIIHSLILSAHLQ